MLAIDIPGFGDLTLEHLVLDFNGTLAIDGALLPGVGERLEALAASVHVHVVTADTRGCARDALAGLPLDLTVLGPGGQARAKLALVRRLGERRVVAIGNGRNDRLMLEAAALGIAVVQAEGGASAAIVGAHVVCPTIVDALGLLCEPRRLLATLRD